MLNFSALKLTKNYAQANIFDYICANKRSTMETVKKIWRFYVEGFKSMTIGKKLWALILVKLALIFLLLRLFFFPDVLQEQYDTDDERAEAVRSALTK